MMLKSSSLFAAALAAVFAGCAEVSTGAYDLPSNERSSDGFAGGYGYAAADVAGEAAPVASRNVPALKMAKAPGRANNFSAVDGRQVAFSATLYISSPDVAAALREATGIARKLGGYASSVNDRGATLKIPVKNAETALAGLEKLGKVDSRNIQAQDVTDTAFDMDMRIGNLEKLRARLTELVEKAKDVKDILAVEKELSRVTGVSIRYLHDDGRAEELVGKDPLTIADMGVSLSFVPEDRLGMGLVGSMDLTDNMALRSYRRGKGPFLDRSFPRHRAEWVVSELSVSTPGVATPVRRLSGGNVQKVLVGREIASAPKVLLTAYAVRGLDIGASYTIYDMINLQKEKGVAVIYVGEDLDVLLELSDRILVLCGGKVSGVVDGRSTTKREVGMMMTRLGGGKSE